MGILLDDAKRWFLGLRVENAPANANPPEGAIKTFNQFKEAFLKRIQRDQENLWREQALIWQSRQKSGQATQAFLNELQEVAGRGRATQEQILTAAIAGLRDDVKTFVLSHELENIQDLQRWANVYEMCTGSKPDASHANISRLEKTFEKFQIRAASPAPRSNSSARQVRFPDRAATPQPSDGTRRSPQRSGGDRGFAPGVWGNGGAGASGNWGYAGARGFGRGQPPRRGTWSRPANQSGRFAFNPYQFPNPNGPATPTPQFLPSRGFRPQYYYARQDNGVASACSNCGRSHQWGQCPARGSICRLCQRPNYWASSVQQCSQSAMRRPKL